MVRHCERERDEARTTTSMGAPNQMPISFHARARAASRRSRVARSRWSTSAPSAIGPMTSTRRRPPDHHRDRDAAGRRCAPAATSARLWSSLTFHAESGTPCRPARADRAGASRRSSALRRQERVPLTTLPAGVDRLDGVRAPLSSGTSAADDARRRAARAP